MKRLLKILAWTGGAILGLLLLLVVGMWLFFPVEKARQLAVEKGTALLGRPLTIESAAVSFWGGLGIKLGDVKVSNPSGWETGNLVEAEEIDVKLAILPLFSGDVSVDKLIINRPVLNFRKRADGSNNFTFAKLEKEAPPELVENVPAEAKAASLAVTFDQLEIKQGQLRYDDDSSQFHLALLPFELATRLSLPEEGLYRTSGKLKVDSLLVTTEKPLPLFSLGVDYQAEYNLNEKLVSVQSTKVRLNDFAFDVSGNLLDPMGQLTGKLNIKTEQIALDKVLSLVPAGKSEVMKELKADGNFSLDIDLDYDASRTDTLLYFGTAVIDNMTLAHKQIPGQLKFESALLDFKNDNLRFSIDKGSFDGQALKGHLAVEDFDNPLVNGELAGGLNLVYLKPFLSQKQAQDVAGEAEFSLKISGRTRDFQQVSFSGDLAVRNGRYNAPLLLEPIENFSLDIYFDNRLTSVKQFSAKTPSGSLSFSGRLNDLVPYLMADSVKAKEISPTVDGRLTGNLNLAVLNPLLPPKGNPDLKGKLDFDMQLRGEFINYEKLEPRGSLLISDAAYSDSLLPEPIREFSADFKVTPDTITVNSMKVHFVSSDASFSGKLVHPFPYLLPMKELDRAGMTKPHFLFKLSSQRFDSDKLFPEAVPGSGDSLAEDVSLDSISTVILPDIDGNGTFQIDTLIYCKVDFTSIEGKVKIRDRKIECYDVTGKAYTGIISGNTTIDLNDFNNPHYDGEFQGTQIEANDFITRFSKFGGYLFGKIDMNGTYSASGWEPELFFKSISMNSTSNMQQGKLVTSGVVFSTLSGLAGKLGQKFDKEQALRDLKTNIVVKDGKVALDNLKTRLGALGDVEVSGFYGFDGGLDYKGSILLSKETTEKLLSNKSLLGDIGSLFADKSVDRVKLPLVFGGTIDKPTFDIDYASLAKNVGDNLKQNLKDDAGNLLNKLLPKKK